MNEVSGYGKLDFMPASFGSLPFYFAPFNNSEVVCAKMVLSHMPSFWSHFLRDVEREDVMIERDGTKIELVECTQRIVGSGKTSSTPASELRISAEFRYALLEMMHQFKRLGGIGYTLGYRNGKREIQITLVGCDQHSEISEPCNFARLFAKKLSAALTDNPVGRIFNTVFDVAVAHLDLPDGPKFRLPFIRDVQRRAANEHTFGMHTEMPFLAFYYERGKFWFNCGSEYRTVARAAKLVAANQALPPLAEQYEGLRWVIDGHQAQD